MISKSEILSIQREIEGYACEMGFDFYPVIYEMVDYHTMSEVAAYGGFPTRYPHWSFGMEYDRLAKGYGSFLGAWRTLQGIEAVHMIRKGRVRRLAKADSVGSSALHHQTIRYRCLTSVSFRSISARPSMMLSATSQ